MLTSSQTFYPEPSISDISLTPSLSIFRINQTPISLVQVLQTLRASRRLQPTLESFASRYVLEETFRRQPELEISVSELEQATEQFKQQFDEAQLQTYLLENAWDESLLRSELEFDLKLEKLKAEIAAPKLLEAFIEQKLAFDQVVLSRIVVEQLDLAEELRVMIVEEEVSFEQSAREYSIVEDAVTNGMMGILSRAEVQATLGLDPYQATLQTVLEPTACNNQWWLIRVEAVLPATLNEQIKQQLQDQLFEQWMMRQMQTLDIELNLNQDTAH